MPLISRKWSNEINISFSPTFFLSYLMLGGFEGVSVEKGGRKGNLIKSQVPVKDSHPHLYPRIHLAGSRSIELTFLHLAFSQYCDRKAINHH